MITLEPVWQDEAQAHLNRALLTAFGHPGEVLDVGRWIGGDHATLGVLATLADSAVTCADPHGLLDERTWSLLGAVPAIAASATFVLVAGYRTPDAGFTVSRGTLLAPERGATVVIRCAHLAEAEPHDRLRLHLEGPGIPRGRILSCAGLDPAWMAWRNQLCAGFPQGIDVVLADEQRLTALPRTTRLSIRSGDS